MVARVEYAPDTPSEVAGIVAPLLERWAALVPTWVHRLTVRFDAEGTDVANIATSPQYRSATMTISPPFLLRSEEMREDTIMHELAHLLTAQQNNACRDVIERFAPEGAPREWADAELVLAIEGANCDIVRAILAVANRAAIMSGPLSGESATHADAVGDEPRPRRSREPRPMFT